MHAICLYFWNEWLLRYENFFFISSCQNSNLCTCPIYSVMFQILLIRIYFQQPFSFSELRKAATEKLLAEKKKEEIEHHHSPPVGQISSVLSCAFNWPAGKQIVFFWFILEHDCSEYKQYQNLKCRLLNKLYYSLRSFLATKSLWQFRIRQFSDGKQNSWPIKNIDKGCLFSESFTLVCQID